MHQTDPSQPRLIGVKRQQWYAQNGNSLEASERAQRELERRAFGYSLAYLVAVQLVVLALASPLLMAVQGSVLGFWFILGRGPFWLRLSVVGGIMLLLGSWIRPQLADLGSRLLLVVALVLGAGLTYLLGISLSRLSPFARRPVQFSLWEIGGCILGCALGFSYARLFRSAEEFAADVSALQFSFLPWVLPLVLNAVVACLPMVLPRSGRKLWHFGLAMLLVWVVLPFVHAYALVFLGITDRDETLFFFIGFVGPAFAWMLALLVEGMGLYLEPTTRSPKPVAKVELDPLGIE